MEDPLEARFRIDPREEGSFGSEGRRMVIGGFWWHVLKLWHHSYNVTFINSFSHGELMNQYIGGVLE